ncbi:MAG TPA: exosortase/archaeosortase family protein [Verrucomicrobiae bacterium]|jgi:exosortase
MRLYFLLLPVGYFWFRLIDDLRLEWSTDPQYSYGWIVPFLCLGLLVRRWQAPPNVGGEESETKGRRFAIILFALFAFLYLPTRLIEASTPEWRPIQWLQGVEAIGLTLCAIYLVKGKEAVRRSALPICFFFVAIPWATFMERAVIQSLTRVNSAMAIEALGWLFVPAVQHGNLIEVSTGTVGVNEACSGIRSFQTSLMISLFFGEFYRMSTTRRLLLIPSGFILAMAFNTIRVTILTYVAAKKGIDAIAEYHDPAGVAITLFCTTGLWGLALLFKKRWKATPQQTDTSDLPSSAAPPSAKYQHSRFQFPNLSNSTLTGFAAGLSIWIICVEVGVDGWYRFLESHMHFSSDWTFDFPKENLTFKEAPIWSGATDALRYDEGNAGMWNDSDGTRWQAFYLIWHPGRVAGYLAKRHTPEVCMTSGGRTLVSGPELTVLNVHGAILPFRCYVFQTETGALHVFQCRWEAGAGPDGYAENDGTHFNLLRGIWAGRGIKGEKVLELAIAGYTDMTQAKAALVRQLEARIKVQKATDKSLTAEGFPTER